MMNIIKEQIMQEIKTLIESKYQVYNLGYDDDLKSYGFSSIQIIEIVIDIEETFQIEFNQGNLNSDMLKNIRSISENVIVLLK